MMNRIMFVLAALVIVTACSVARAIDGPGALAISNANWGTGNDIWPHVARIEIDLDNDGMFNDLPGSTHCTGTMVAPDVIVTAAHCFQSFVAAGGNIGAGRARVNFGNLPNGPSTFLNSGGRVHPSVTIPVTVPSANDLAYLTLNGVPDPMSVSPIAVLPRPARVGDTNFAIGYGIGDTFGPGPAAAPSFGVRQHLGGGQGRAAGAKGWTTLTVDGVTASHVTQTQNVGEDFTEGGDSGGPGIQRHIFPNRAWASNIAPFARDDFVMSAVHGGFTPSPNPAGGFNYDSDGTTPGVQPGTDYWTRLDNQGNFINEAIALGATQIFHNLPQNPMALNPNDTVKVLIKAGVNALEPYTLNINLWEEDDDFLVTHNFTGDMTLAPTPFADDLAGFGHSAGVAPAGVSMICAWQELKVGDLLAYDENLNPLDPPLDWVFKLNYADSGQSTNPAGSTLAQINTEIANCTTGIAAGNTIRGGFAMIPEPATFALLGVVGVIALRRKQRR